MAQRTANLFKKNICQVIGMIHVDALPGTPKYAGNFQKSVEKVRKEANIYKKCKVDMVMIENMHDVPYIQSRFLGPETTACMTRLAMEVKSALPNTVPCGIQILACGNNEALAVAKASNLDFIRVEGFVFSHIADEGFTDANAGHILRYRKQIDAENISIFTDIKKKHSSHSITKDVSLLETAKAAEFFLSDGVIITGSSTGAEANLEDLKALTGKMKIPLLIGSGITTQNIRNYFGNCDAVIVGSHFKKSGHWSGELCVDTVRKFMEKIEELRINK